MNTVFLGKELIRLKSVDSTNNYASDLLRKGMLPDGAVIVAEEQFSGRGQRGNSWQSAPGQNLTMSCVLKSWKVDLPEQFKLSMVVALGVCDCLNSFQQGFQLKWPNDILYKEKKVGGILIENVVKARQVDMSIVGIGINVNQENFDLPNATSLKQIVGREIEIEEVLLTLLPALESRLLSLKNAGFDDIKARYFQNLFGVGNEVEIVIESTKELCLAKIAGLEKSGKIIMEIAQEKRVFDLKEISFRL